MKISNYEVDNGLISFPSIVIGGDFSTKEPIQILEQGLYKPPVYKTIVVKFLRDYKEEIKKRIETFFSPEDQLFKNRKIKKFELLSKEQPIEVKYDNRPYPTLKTLEDDLGFCSDSKEIYLIVHSDNLNETDYYKFKAAALNSKCRTQFFNIEHVPYLASGNSAYTIFNAWVQLAAKMDGVPWIVNTAGTNYKPIDSTTLIMGIAFSAMKEGVVYGVANFIDYSGIAQQLKIFKIEREYNERSLYLTDDEMKYAISEAVKWFVERKRWNYAGDLSTIKLFIYKTTPLYQTEEEAINDILSKPTILSQSVKEIKIAHIHMKSEKFGIPRMYNLLNKEYYVKKGYYTTIYPESQIKAPLDETANRIKYKGEVIFFPTGLLETGKTTLGTPKPLFMSVHSNFGIALNTVIQQIPLLNLIDWEAGINVYRAREPSVIKYARRMAKITNYTLNDDKYSLNDSAIYDVRDIM